MVGEADSDPLEVVSPSTSIVHSREKVQLCYEIVLDNFGGLAARVALILLQRGRLTLREICRFLANPTLHAPTGYIDGDDTNTDDAHLLNGSSSVSTQGPIKSQRLIQQALFILIQHNVCWFASSNPDGTLVEQNDNEDALLGTEYFQMNVDSIIPRLRYGAYLEIAEQTFNEVGRDIIDEVLKSGKVLVADVIDKLGGPESLRENHQRRTVVTTVLTDLLYEAYVKPCSREQQTSHRDWRIHFESKIMKTKRSTIGRKEQLEIARQARDKTLEQENKVWWCDNKRFGFIPLTKRKANGKIKAASSKKSRTSNGKTRKSTLVPELSDSEDDDDQRRRDLQIDPNIILMINPSRFDIHLRDQIMIDAVDSRYNETVAGVMQCMLQHCAHVQSPEFGVPNVNATSSPSFHINTIKSELPSELVLKRAFDRDAIKKHVGSDVTQSTLLEEVARVLMGSGDTSRTGLSKRFVSPALQTSTSLSSARPTTLQIQYRNAARALRQQILHNVVIAKFESSGIRVIAVLSEMGKLDEKQISKLCLMAISETRDVCARLFAAGLLSLQEVPKSSDRTAARTFFLWYVDTRKCNAWLANHLYKTLSRIAQRRRYEYLREKDLINKSQRTDVANDESMMREVERIRLQRVRDTINTLTLAEQRTWRDLLVVTTLPD